MVRKSTIDTGNYKTMKQLNLPRTEQIKFNTKLNLVAKRYARTDPKLHHALKQHICSEPLPCPVYCLPKDHKDGDLKGRPIHAATDTPATSLSKYLAKCLNPLLRHVPAHLKNTQDFINCLDQMEGETIHSFCSLDVCNLYGSIPLKDVNAKTPSVFTVAKRFFEKHKHDSELKAMSNSDFETLVHLCLESDSILIDGKGFKQQSGLAMGNNLAPVLAIIYMNEIDQQITTKTNGLVILKRYIDDYFAFILSRQISGDRLLTIANSINEAIKFTIELPNEGQLPFLDTMVTFNPETNNFSTKLYIKPIHSNCIVPWDSHGSLASKRAILIGEINRAVSRSTDDNNRKESLSKLTQVFARNGYPKSFVRASVHRVLHNQPRINDQEDWIYMKLPYINEEFKRRSLAVVRRSGLNNIKIHFLNGKSSSQRFAPRKETMNCSNKCETCKSGKKPNRCHNKNVALLISRSRYYSKKGVKKKGTS